MSPTPPFRTIGEAKHFLITTFRTAGLDSADIDARLLLMQSTGLERADLIAGASGVLRSDVIKDIVSMATRRIAGEPVDNILGFREFYGRRFKVTKDVLSPRPETEMLVAHALSLIEVNPNAKILELGSGSGAIIISILAETISVRADAIDISEPALKIARENAQNHGVLGRVNFIQGDWLASVSDRYNIIVSNPPYIRNAVLQELQNEVKNFDPPLALCGGVDGLGAYRKIISSAKTHLVKDGKILVEIGFDQAATVYEIFKEAKFTNIEVHKDLAAHDRMITADCGLSQ